MITTDEIATADEIYRRIEEVDAARSARRSTAARQVGELAQHRAVLAGQLDEIERQLGEVLVGASDVMSVEELSRFTGVSADVLTRWLTVQKPARTKRKKVAAGVGSDMRQGPVARPPTIGQASTSPERVGSRSGSAAGPDRVAAG
jgi:hypothetical protein